MSTAGRYGWYWRRFRAMSMAEALHRLKRGVQMGLERIGVGVDHQVPTPQLIRPPVAAVTSVPSIDPVPYVEAADNIVAGRFQLFADAAIELGNPPAWNRDPLTGIDAPMRYGKTLNYRNADRVGDIKYLWELNRHLHLVTLAQAYRLRGDEAYLRTIVRHIESWEEACPYPLGPNWTSSLELAIRLINWALVWDLLADVSPLFGDGGGRVKTRWLRLVYRHAQFIHRHLSRFSSANNHLIGEAVGLMVAGARWPNWPIADKWFDRGRRELAREALVQNAPDGVNLEQSTWYQHFVLQFLILGGLLARLRGQDFEPRYWSRVEAMIQYLAAVTDVAGNTPMIGDADDGFAFRLDPRHDASPFRSLFATGAVLFSRHDLRAKAKHLDEGTLWLLGSAPRRVLANAEKLEPLQHRNAFPDGGYYVLGMNLESRHEVRLVVDAGPLGYGPIAAHGHADALAFTLSAAGHEILIDPGTYAYHTQPRWRSYFRGTAAHNTARVDGENQSVIGGPFLWSSRAEARCEIFEPGPTGGRFVGSHDGYLRLRDPVLHRREIHLAGGGGPIRIRVIDTFVCEGSHRVELFAHFAQECTVRSADRSIVARRSDVEVAISMTPDPVQIELHSGDPERPAGWVSPSFDVLQPTTTAIWTAVIEGTTSLLTLIECSVS